ncbi:MAG: hypothetical protein ACOC44_14165 [Promethearchaeia archaeon]
MTSESLLREIFKKASQLKIPIVILGGLALPAYNVARSTLDIDIAIGVNNQTKLKDFISALKKVGIKTLQNPKIGQDLFTVFGFRNEAEIWLKPCDAFDWDEQMVQKIKKYSGETNVLAIEDFILTKLVRADRSSTDISDILQILINNYRNIDWEYLNYRLNWAKARDDFEQILKVSTREVKPELSKIISKIRKKINQNS